MDMSGWLLRLFGLPPRYLIEGGNPGGWPTGPLECRAFYNRRDACNAGADLWDTLVVSWAEPAVRWLARRLPGASNQP
jgi:hypothetical protein